MKRYCWYGQVVQILLKNNNLRNPTLLIIKWLSENINDLKIELTIETIRKEIEQECGVKIALSTILRTLSTLEKNGILEYLQRGTKSASTIYRVLEL